ncbi:MAG: MBL fold metallo-hydrolase [Candidatus Omnitrophota bacterium]
MSQIKITILGTTAAIPTRSRAHAAMHLNYTDAEEFCCLFDCGEGAQRQLLYAGLNLMKIDNVFITHWHGDHSLGLPGLIDTMGFCERKAPFNLYAPEVKRAEKSLGLNYPAGSFKILPCNVPEKGSDIKVLLETERFQIVSIPAKHGVPSVSYAFMEKDNVCIDLSKAKDLGLPEKGDIYKKLKEGKAILKGGKHIVLKDVSMTVKGKKVVYSGDTEVCDNLEKLINGADLLIQDCTYFEDKPADKPYKHAAFPEIVEMVSGGNVKKIVLTHISRKYQDMKQLKKIIEKYPNFEIAEDFMKVEV